MGTETLFPSSSLDTRELVKPMQVGLQLFFYWVVWACTTRAVLLVDPYARAVLVAPCARRSMKRIVQMLRDSNNIIINRDLLELYNVMLSDEPNKWDKVLKRAKYVVGLLWNECSWLVLRASLPTSLVPSSLSVQEYVQRRLTHGQQSLLRCRVGALHRHRCKHVC